MASPDIASRLADLRDLMRREHLGAFIFPSTDPHHSEYVAPHWKGREWISGFSGSAGTAVVTLTAAALWTDSRYFLSAASQLQDTEYQLMRQGLEETPSMAQWIAGQLRDTDYTEIGIDGMTATATETEQLIADMRRSGITVRTNLDPLAQIWTSRPPVPCQPVTIHPLSLAGEPAHEKLARIRRELRRQHADGMLVCALDDIAWTLNLRGHDVPCNPVFVSYLLVSTTQAVLYINKEKLSAAVQAYLADEGVSIDDYEHVRRGLRDYFEYNILLDPDEVNYTLFCSGVREVVRGTSPIPAMKAVKNESEVAGFHEAMLRDGIAMVQFLQRLQSDVAQGRLTERGVDQLLTALRAAQPGFRERSFATIAAYQEHGAIVHYEATADTDALILPKGLLLLDSGGQYDSGTTDITRTIALGPLTDEQRRVYTLVLKAHLALQTLVFPDGATGTQLDAVARQPLWREGLNYLHGTGHGVGACLCVHEGPHQIRMEWRGTPLRAGMTVTCEPGIYLPGRFGVRIENTLLVRPWRTTEQGRFLCFEPLTLCPVDTTPVIREMLTPAEKGWLDSYHAHVREQLLPHLDAEAQDWLRKATAPL